jgi:hypothetical protein
MDQVIQTQGFKDSMLHGFHAKPRPQEGTESRLQGYRAFATRSWARSKVVWNVAHAFQLTRIHVKLLP